MKFKPALISLLLLLSAIVNGVKSMDEIPGKTITLETLVEMFDNIREQSQWNISGDMLWGYFFTHENPQKLEEASKHLVGLGYRFVNIYLSDKDDPNEPDLYWLHVEKVETHTPESLDKRNDELYLIALKFGIDSYDGMDVGPVHQ